MPNPPALVYWDSCVFLRYIDDDPETLPVLDALLGEVERSRGERKIVTSAVAQVEVAFATSEKEARAMDTAVTDRIDAFWSDDTVIGVIEFHDQIARMARDLIRVAMTSGRSLKPLDAIHLASAQWAGAVEMHTYDSPLQGFADQARLRICEPYVLQPPLLRTL